ncbi:hypothetical protein [Paenibacillus sp. CCS19]|nr:hypothetical protein [Paenibacillus cellulosilyticus]
MIASPERKLAGCKASRKRSNDSPTLRAAASAIPPIKLPALCRYGKKGL